MKILHLIQRYPPAVGGSETWCREVSRYLRSRGDDVKVLTLNILEEEEYWREPPPRECMMRVGRLDWDDGILVRRYKRSLPIHILHHLGFKILLDRICRIYFYGPHSAEMYARLLSEVRAVDVVHLHTIPYPHIFIGYLAARLLQKRVVITPHFHPGHPHYERRSNYWLLKHCDAVIAVSEYERDYIVSQGVKPEKIIVTGNGVHTEDYVPQETSRFRADLLRTHRFSESTKIILFVGRKLEYKGIDTLIEAFRRLVPHTDAALILVGPNLEWFEKLYGQLSAKERERIIDLGSVPHADKVHLLHLADVLVLPSRFEAFGIVFLEAWACGTPVIGAATGAIPSVVRDGGLTFEYGNAEDLAQKLDVLLHDHQLAKEMARNGLAKVLQRYTWDKIGAATRTAYLPQTGRQLRILICSNLFPPHYLGGAELVAYQQAKILKAFGHDVRVFCGRISSEVMRPFRVKHEGGEFHKTWVHLSPKDICGDQWDFLNPQVTHAFAQVVAQFSPDVVHFHNVVGLSVKMIDECHARNIPTVMTLHDYWGICFKNTLLKNNGNLCSKGGFDCLSCRETLWMEPPIPSPVRNSHILTSLQKVTRFIAPSHYLAERYADNGIPRDKISVIKNGIELDRFQVNVVPHQHNVLRLGFIGHLGKHKGLEYLIRALSFVDLEKVRLLVVGTGDEAGFLRTLCHELHMEEIVTFVGHVENERIATIYEQIDVLVVPSVWQENSPVTITEAMASGMPVIASNIGGIGELVDDGSTGFLVPPQDSQALADRIGRFLTRPELKREMGERARARINQYGIRGQVGQVLTIYRDLLGREGAKRPPDYDVVLYESSQPWTLELHTAFRQLAEAETRLARRLLPCRLELSDERLLRSAKLLLMTSANRDSWHHALQALQRGIPIVVHTGVGDLKELCLASNAGLFYADSEECKECLTLLLSNEPLRRALGENGRKFVEDQIALATA